MTDPLEHPFPRPLSGRPLADAPACRVPAREPLLGRHISLEPLDPAVHAAELYAAGHDSNEALRVWDYLPFGPAPDEAAFCAWLSAMAVDPDWIWFALRPRGSGKVFGKSSGMACFMDIQPQNGAIEIGGIWFAPELQRTRAGAEALFLMLAHAMDDLGYRRMQWRCNALNVKSREAARRLGFRFEGVFYNHRVIKGRSRDTACYSILDDEWPEVREIIGAWLHDDNFDAAGKARNSLSQAMQKRGPSLRG